MPMPISMSGRVKEMEERLVVTFSFKYREYLRRTYFPYKM